MSEINEEEPENQILSEKEIIENLIVHRSLYILKKKFEIYKDQINQIYKEYKEKSSKLIVIPVNNIYDVISNIMKIAKFYPITSNNFNELITADLMTSSMKNKSELIIKDICDYIKEKLSEYNSMFYERKMKEIQIQKKVDEINKENEIEKNIFLYDKRGNLVQSNVDINKNNVEFDVDGIVYIITEEDMNILNSNRYIYSEVIPLIIADYIQKHLKVSLVSINNELNKDLGTLFDNEILKKISFLEKYDPNEELNGKIKVFLLEKVNVENQIKIFENLLYEKNKSGENTGYIMDMIQKLKSKKSMLENNISNYKNLLLSNNSLNNDLLTVSYSNKKKKVDISYSKLSKEELRKKALTEIFQFYCKQHNLIGSIGNTFDGMKYNESNLNLSEFVKFCVDFKILVKKRNLNGLYKVTTEYRSNMKFEEFLIIIPKLSIAVNEEKIYNIKSRIKLCQFRLNEILDEEKNKNHMMIKQTEEKAVQEEEIKENDNQEEKKMDIDSSEKKDENNENKTNENPETQNIKVEVEDQNVVQKESSSLDINHNIENENIQNNNNSENNLEIKKTDDIERKEDDSKKVYKQGNKKITETKKIITTTTRKRSILLYTKEELIETIKKYKEQLKILESKSTETLLEEFYLYLEIDHPKLYRKKMIGFVLPFSIREKDDFRYPKMIDNNNKNKEKYEKEKKEILERLYEEREIAKKMKEEKEKKSLLLKKKKQINESMKLLSIKNKKEKSYIKILQNKHDYESGKVDKITWNELEKYDYNDFVANTDENQKPKQTQSEINILQTKKPKANINNYHVDTLFKNNDTLGVDEEDQELLGHLIVNDNSRNNKNNIINNNVKYSKVSIDASGNFNDDSNKKNQKKNNPTFPTEVDYNSKRNKKYDYLISSKDVVKSLGEKNEQRKKDFERNYNQNIINQQNNNANIIKKYEKVRTSNKNIKNN